MDTKSVFMFWDTYKSYARKTILPEATGVSRDIPYWRNEIFLTILIFVAPLSIVALVPSVYMAFMNGVPVVGIADIIAFASIVFIMVSPGLTLKLRKSILICVSYALSLTLLYYLSMPGPGLLFLLTVTLFTAIIYSDVAATYSSLANTFICICFTLLIYSGIDTPITSSYSVGAWIAVSSNLVFLSFVCAECVNLLFKGLEASLGESKNLSANLTSIIESTDANIYSLDKNHRYIAFNQALKNAVKRSYNLEVKPGDKVFSFLEKENPEEVRFWKGIYNEALTGKVLKFERTFSFKELTRTVSFSLNPIFEGRDITGISCFATDVTDLKNALLEIQKLNQGLEEKIALRTASLIALNNELEQAKNEIFRQNEELEQKVLKRTTRYAYLSQINQAIVHTKDEKKLFNIACRVAVDIGRFRIAWIGLFDKDQTRITLIEHHGIAPDDLIHFSNIALYPNGPQESVMRTGNHFVCNDIDHSVELKNWKPLAAAQGVHSCMILPIKKLSSVIGSINYYSSEYNFFTEEETALLLEVAADISFALDNYEKEKKQRIADKIITNTTIDLQRTLSDLQKIMNASMDMICSIDSEGEFVKVSAASEQILGYRPEELKGKKYIDLVFKDDVEKTMRLITEVMNGIPITSFENRYIHKNRSIVSIFWSATWDQNDRLMYCILRKT